jgi:hypothetical protein
VVKARAEQPAAAAAGPRAVAGEARP